MTDQLDSHDRVTGAPAPGTADSRRKRQAISGALAGVAVIAVLVGAFVVIQVNDDGAPAPVAAAPAPSAAPSQPEAAPSQPAPPAAPPGNLDPALQEKPTIEPGRGAVRKVAVKTVVKGEGPALKAGQQVTLNYVGATYADGK